LLQTIILVALLAALQASPVITVTTDRPRYFPGEQVIVHVAVARSLEADRIWVYIDRPDNYNFRYAYLPPSGGDVVFILPADAMLGTWMITVTWNHEYVRITFEVSSFSVPEFSTAFLVLLLAFTAAILAVQNASRGRLPPLH